MSNQIIASSITFKNNPDTVGKYWHTVSGSNLGLTQKIKIIYIVDGTAKTYIIRSSELGSYFQSTGGSDMRLYIPEFDPSKNCTVNILFYDNDNSENYQSQLVSDYTAN